MEFIMAIELKTYSFLPEEEYNIPLDISDIINICREYNKLGMNIQSQVESILENGVEEAMEMKIVKEESLPHIKHFLKAINNNAYFGDAASQANDVIMLITQYEKKNQNNFRLYN